MCFFPVMVTSSSTSSEGRGRATPSLASDDATLTFSEGAGLGNLLRSVNEQAATVGSGCPLRRTRSMSTLLAICCSNEQIYAGVGGKVGHLAPEQCVKCKKISEAIRWRRVNGTVVLSRANQDL